MVVDFQLLGKPESLNSSQLKDVIQSQNDTCGIMVSEDFHILLLCEINIFNQMKAFWKVSVNFFYTGGSWYFMFHTFVYRDLQALGFENENINCMRLELKRWKDSFPLQIYMRLQIILWITYSKPLGNGNVKLDEMFKFLKVKLNL